MCARSVGVQPNFGLDVVETSEKNVVIKGTEAKIGECDYACHFARRNDVFSVKSTRSSGTALKATTEKRHDIMDLRNTLGHPHEELTRVTSMTFGITLTGDWTACMGCSKVKAHRMTPPQKTDNRSATMLGRVFMDLSGPKAALSKGRSFYAITIVDDYTRMKWVRFAEGKGSKGLADVRRNFIADKAKPENLTIGAVRTNEGGGFKGDFQ